MKWTKSKGLIAATLAPYHPEDGSVNVDIIGRYVDHLLSLGITQVFGELALTLVYNILRTSMQFAIFS